MRRNRAASSSGGCPTPPLWCGSARADRSGRSTAGRTTTASCRTCCGSKSGAPRAKTENARLRGRLRGMRVASGGARVIPRHAADLRTRDTDVGKFTVVQACEFPHALMITPPRPKHSDKTRDEHGAFPFLCGRKAVAGYSSESGAAALLHVALQLIHIRMP